jgi:hypothetical protein
MQTYLAVAAGVAVLTGVAHSLLGEMIIFRQLRRGTLVPGQDAPPLRSRNIRIIWATWHVATLFGWAFAGVLLQLALSPQASLVSLFLNATVAAYAGGSLLVLVGTRGRHPGWIALAAVAALVWIGAGTA